MGWLFVGKGVFRTIGATLSSLGGIALVTPIPVVQMWAPVLLAVGSAISTLGIARAAARFVVSKIASENT